MTCSFFLPFRQVVTVTAIKAPKFLTNVNTTFKPKYPTHEKIKI